MNLPQLRLFLVGEALKHLIPKRLSPKRCNRGPRHLPNPPQGGVQYLPRSTMNYPQLPLFLDREAPEHLRPKHLSSMRLSPKSLSPKSLNPKNVKCPSGNCTFASDNGASYSSVAVCQKSQDITQYIQNHTLPGGFRNYSLPSGPNLDVGYLLSSVVIDDRKPVTYGADDLINMLFTFDALMYIQNKYDAEPFAIRSSIYPCVKTWGANITLNELRETEVTSVPMERNYFASHSYLTNHTLRNGTWQACNPTSHMTDTNTVSVTKDGPPHNGSFWANNVENGTTLWYPFDCTWLLGRTTRNAIISFLDSLFNYNNLTQAVTTPIGDLWLKNLYMNGSANMSTANDYMERLASSVTATIRSHGDPAPTPYTNYASGAVLENQTCIQVSWAWLALPASLILCSIMFLAATIILTSAKRCTDPANAWISTAGPLKSSPLPLLFHGIESSALLATGHPSNLTDMQRVAETLDVRLGRSPVDGNWYFLRDESQRRFVEPLKRDV